MIKRMFGIALLATLLLSACTAMPPMTGDMDASMENKMDDMAEMVEPVPGEITILNQRSRPSPMAAGNGAAYMLILNGLEEDVQVVSATSPAAAVVELHETIDDNGVMRMVPQPEGFAVPAGGSVELMPGGKHVMLIDLVDPLETGEEIEITLNFNNGESIDLTVPVVQMDGMPMNMEMDHGDDDEMEQEGEMSEDGEDDD
jgi:copper(I)-binding protein